MAHRLSLGTSAINVCKNISDTRVLSCYYDDCDLYCVLLFLQRTGDFRK
jgi:hypothetical protein